MSSKWGELVNSILTILTFNHLLSLEQILNVLKSQLVNCPDYGIICAIAEGLGVSVFQLWKLIHIVFKFKVSASWVTQDLTFDQKAIRVAIATKLLKCYEKGRFFLEKKEIMM